MILKGLRAWALNVHLPVCKTPLIKLRYFTKRFVINLYLKLKSLPNLNQSDSYTLNIENESQTENLNLTRDWTWTLVSGVRVLNRHDHFPATPAWFVNVYSLSKTCCRHKRHIVLSVTEKKKICVLSLNLIIKILPQCHKLQWYYVKIQ